MKRRQRKPTLDIDGDHSNSPGRLWQGECLHLIFYSLKMYLKLLGSFDFFFPCYLEKF